MEVNVGGTIFTTTKDTLMKIPYFESYFRVSGEIKKNEMIDRDHKIFRHVLNYARDHNYRYPEKYLEELAFWGLGYEIVSNDIKDIVNKGEKKNSIDGMNGSPFAKYVWHNPTYTFHRDQYNRYSYIHMVPSMHTFDTNEWEVQMEGGSIKHMFLLVSCDAKLSDIKFEFMMKGDGDKDYVTYTYDLEASNYLGEFKVEVVDNYYHIPLYFFGRSNNNILYLFNPKCRFKYNGNDKIKSAIRYYNSHIDSQEKDRFENVHCLEIITEQIISLEINDNDIIDISAYTIGFIVWKVEDAIDYVELIGDDYYRCVTKIEFEYETRAIAGLGRLSDGWGAIHNNITHNKIKYIPTILYSKNLKIKFPKKTTGKIWLSVLESILYYSATKQIKRSCTVEDFEKLNQAIGPGGIIDDDIF